MTSEQALVGYNHPVHVSPKTGGEHGEHYAWLTTAYRETAKAVDNKELGWGLFICQK